MTVASSKLVTDKEKSRRIVVSTREQMNQVADSLAARFPRATRAPIKAGVLLVAGAMLDWLDRDCDAMVKADQAHWEEAGDDALIRDARNEPAEQVRSSLIDLRGVLTVFFGEQVLPLFGIGGATPSDPVVLHRSGLAALERLRNFIPPKARMPSMRFDPSEWIALLAEPVAALGRALDAVASDERLNQMARNEKNRAIETYDATFRLVTNFLVGLFIAAGEDKLAEKVRPSVRRAGQTANEAPAPPTGSVKDD